MTICLQGRTRTEPLHVACSTCSTDDMLPSSEYAKIGSLHVPCRLIEETRSVHAVSCMPKMCIH